MAKSLSQVWKVVADWISNPACPWCGERSTDLEWHYTREHAGDTL